MDDAVRAGAAPFLSAVFSGEHRKKGKGGLVNGPMMRLAVASSVRDAVNCAMLCARLDEVGAAHSHEPAASVTDVHPVDDVVNQPMGPCAVWVVGQTEAPCGRFHRGVELPSCLCAAHPSRDVEVHCVVVGG